ncbi:MAG: bifunctional DNA primase/polymerase, partial [Lentisphaerae bacterium]|nr:bifunctional DNA primase/polymerase [Lentisphaerota bacterium]
MVNMKQYALAYLKYGIAIVPLHNVQNGTCTCLKGQRCGKSSGKHPRLTNWQGNWSRDPKQIEKWWTTWPDANIGMVTGKASGGICVVDVDEEIGRTNLKKYVNGLKVPVAGTARTNFDGEHWYFRTDKDVPDRIKGINGLDFRNSGIIVLPPSQGLAKRYKWKASLKGIEVPDIPDKLLSDLTQVNVSQSDLSQVNVSHATNESFKGKEGSPPGEAVKPKDYIKALYKFISNTLIFKDNSYKIKDHYLYRDSGTCTLMFTDGRRENDLFSLANALVKAGKDRQFIMEVMTRVMFTCHDVDPSFILRKIDNAVTRHGEPVPSCTIEDNPVPSCTIEDNPVPSVPSVPGRVREYVGYAEGTFSTSDVYRDLGLVTATDKTNCRKT